MEKILFVCTANIDRSPTAEDMYKNDDRFEVRSCGTWNHARTPVSQELLDWADRVFVMNEEEDNHKSIILENFNIEEEKIIDLDISDVYSRGHPKLKKLLKERLDPYLE